MFSFLISNNIFILVICFTELVDQEEPKEIMGRVILAILGLYSTLMIIVIIWYGFGVIE